jgi:lipoprotein-releasing system ATP-binding protein
VSDATTFSSPAATPTTARPIVEVVDVHKRYLHEEKSLDVLKGVSLTIGGGDFVSIAGKSGAGKSTLLHLIGILDRPTGGSITIDGLPVASLSGVRAAEVRNRTIGFVFQFHHLLPEFSAVENVMMPGLILGQEPRGALERRAKDLLGDVGLGHRYNHRPSELSGGEQQRVALARALILSPKLLLADEPTGNLDTQNSEAMNELFFKINRERGTTLVIVTHNEGLAARAPRQVKMEDGLIVADSRQPGEGLYRENEPPSSLATPAATPAGTDAIAPAHEGPERGV